MKTGDNATVQELPPKPVVEIWQPEKVKLPQINLGRRLARGLLRGVSRGLVRGLTRTEVVGRENFPRRGPALVVFNHLGDGDVVMMLAVSPVALEFMAKIDMPKDMPLIARLAEAYGVIWVHRGRPDRRALRAALDGLAEGRVLAIAPEARYSLTGALEPATEGAAFLALRSGVPVVPVALSGTENANLYTNLKRLRRPAMRVQIGQPFYLSQREGETRRAAIRRGTEEMMCRLAGLLPPAYRGVYADCAWGGETPSP